MSNNNRQQKPQTAPEVQIALTQKLIGNQNEDLKTGSSSITSSQIISGNMFRFMIFSEWLKQHRVKVGKGSETFKAATTALTTKIEAGGQRGAIKAILAPTAEQNNQSVQAATQVNQAQEQKE